MIVPPVEVGEKKPKHTTWSSMRIVLAPTASQDDIVWNRNSVTMIPISKLNTKVRADATSLRGRGTLTYIAKNSC